jgi:thiamine-phosphate pyrophosphorylase
LAFPRFYPILDTALLASHGMDLLTAARALLDAGAQILQLRHKQRFTRRDLESARALATLASASGAALIINDRADIAALFGSGLHTGQDDLHPSDARALIGPAAILGFSTHSPRQLLDAAGLPLSYVAFGPVFPTRSKLNPDPTVGLGQIAQVRPLTSLPLIAIGGITRETAPAVLDAGADSVAIISDLYPEPLDAAQLYRRAAEWMRIIAP